MVGCRDRSPDGKNSHDGRPGNFKNIADMSTNKRSKQVCEQEKTKQMQIELEMMRLRVSMKKFDLV
jgi:hypothetical protein